MSEDQVVVRTEPTLDGDGYIVTVEFSDDETLALDQEAAYAYAAYVLAACVRAQYDAGVMRQMKALGVPKDAATQMVSDLRKGRPSLDHRWPITLEPIVSIYDGHPRLNVHYGRTLRGQWEISPAQDHALGVLEALEAADLDTAYHHALVSKVGIETERARAVVQDVGSYLAVNE